MLAMTVSMTMASYLACASAIMRQVRMMRWVVSEKTSITLGNSGRLLLISAVSSFCFSASGKRL